MAHDTMRRVLLYKKATINRMKALSFQTRVGHLLKAPKEKNK